MTEDRLALSRQVQRGRTLALAATLPITDTNHSGVEFGSKEPVHAQQRLLLRLRPAASLTARRRSFRQREAAAHVSDQQAAVAAAAAWKSGAGRGAGLER